ncbi:hypothetical protein ACH40F_58415 [Streptomyces sp. NPDC020794]|uniref:hypothetical protein n=1 Tax=unclassified Streptomyces TaxID=2593676 RepID=UPI0036E7B7E9
MTEELLMEAEYRAGEVPEEPAEEWESITIDITDARGERTYVHVRKDQLCRVVRRGQRRQVALGPCRLPGQGPCLCRLPWLRGQQC